MADISSYVAQIEVASRGEDVRDAIVDALEAINDGSAWNGDGVPTEGSERPLTSGGAYNALAQKQDKLVFDSTPAQNSRNPVTSGGVYEALQHLQPTVEMDDEPTQGSTNPVTSGGVYDALQDVQVDLDLDDAPTSGSENPVTSGGVYNAIRNVHLLVRKATITLGTEWAGEDPFTQTVSLSGVAANDKIDLQPGAEALSQFFADGIRAVWIENNNGVLTANCLGGYPSVEMSVQCTIESVADADLYDTLSSIQTALAGKQNRIWMGSISLAAANWEGADPYTQIITLAGVTANSLVDLMPGLDVQASAISDGVIAMYVDNNNGVLTAVAIGGRPTINLTVPVLVTELSTEPAGS